MPLQPPNYFGSVDPTNPLGTDSRTISDDYHRMALASLQLQSPNWTGEITATHQDVNTLTGLAANGTKPMPGVGGTTVLFFYNVNTPPPGWTLNVPDANIRSLVIGDAVDGGSIGGSDNPVDTTYPLSVSLTSVAVGITGNAGGHILQKSELPSLDLEVTAWGADGTAFALRTSNGASLPKQVSIPDSNGNGSHDHDSGTLAGTVTDPASTGNLTIQPRYASGILGTLDA